MDSQIFVNVYNQIQQFWTPIMWCSYLVGFYFLIVGIFKLSESSQRGEGKAKGLLLILIGLFGTNFGWFLDVAATSVFGSAFTGSFVTGNGLRANISTTDAQAEHIMMFVVASIKLIGFIGIWKGLFTLKKDPNQGGSFAIGITYILGGAMALNFELFAKTVAASVGGDVSKIINQFF